MSARARPAPPAASASTSAAGGGMFDRIRAAVRRIPRGQVATYGQVALGAGYPGAARQVVWALRQSRGLPWHRVVGAGGAIRLPGADGMEQRLRLESEGVTFRGRRARMDLHEFRFPEPRGRS